MGYARTVAPTELPVTLDVVKEQCSLVGVDDHDGYVAGLIESATATIEKRIGRQIMPATWTLTLDCFPDEIVVGKLPVSAVSKIEYYDTAGVKQTLAAANYQVDLASPDEPARIKPAYGLVWPSTRSDYYGAVIVTFTAGYATAAAVPPPIKHAVMFLVAHWFDSHEPVILGTIIATVPNSLDMLLSLEDWGGYA